MSVRSIALSGRSADRRSLGSASAYAVGVANRLAGVVLVLALWEVVPYLGVISRTALPPLAEVVAAFGDLLGRADFWSALRETVTGWAIGLAIAVVAGLIVGLLIGTIPWARQITESTIEFLRPIPSVALIPLVVLVYGTDIRSALVLVVYASFWQMLIQVLYGMQDVDPVVRETARSYRFGTLARIRYVVWPTALPYVMTGLRLAATVALVLEITAELVIGGRGLGSLLARAQSSGATDNTYAIVVVTGLVGVAVNLLAHRAERAVLAWHPSHREVPV